MSVLHCLFWIKGNMIMSLLYESGAFNILKLKGMKAVPYADSFWNEWKEYAGMCYDDKVDFCIIYDKKIIPNEQLLAAQCESTDCIWSKNKIEKAVEVLEIKEPTEIRNENGVILVKTGCFLNARKEEISTMTAWYGQADKESEKEETLIEKITPLIRYYKGELQEYKEGYER